MRKGEGVCVYKCVCVCVVHGGGCGPGQRPWERSDQARSWESLATAAADGMHQLGQKK